MDVSEVLKRVDLRELAEHAGARFNNANRSRCPLHGGNNPTAFSIYQGQDGVWRWHCFTGCQDGNNSGDVIKFYMLRNNCDFKTALAALASMAGVVDNKKPYRPAWPTDTQPSIRPVGTPPVQWQARAAAFVDYAHGQLATAGHALNYLYTERGLTDDTIDKFRLGYNPKDLHDQPGRWGLSGKPVYLAKGIVIPHVAGCNVHYVNIRRAAGDPKYCGPRGGVRGLFPVEMMTGKPVVLMCEGEFDAMLAWQAASDLVDVATIGGARQHLDVAGAAVLARALCIIAVLDDDLAGVLGKLALGALSDRIAMEQPPAHDITDYWRAGGNVRAWIAGLVIRHAETALQDIDEEKQPVLFTRWIEYYTKSLDCA